MTSRDFCYWLMGSFEISGDLLEHGLNKEQCELIKKHLQMVFLHEIDPSFGEDNEELDRIHNGETGEEYFYRINPHLDPNRPYRDGEPRLKC